MQSSSFTRAGPGQSQVPAGQVPAGHVPEPGLEQRLAQLLDRTFAEMLRSERRADPMFRSHAGIVALSHHAYGHEARLVEQATIHALRRAAASPGGASRQAVPAGRGGKRGAARQ